MNEDIIIALKNSIDRGENLKTASQTLINSGYNAKEVNEASKYVSSGVTTSLQTKPDEQLTMPEKRGFLRRRKKPIPSIQPNQNAQQIKQTIAPQRAVARPFHPQKPLPEIKTKPKEKPKEKKPNLWIKEVILFIILLILIGVLIATLLFKAEILAFFSG
jgi:hypothetical protein